MFVATNTGSTTIIAMNLLAAEREPLAERPGISFPANPAKTCGDRRDIR